jgi:hypothetical protein
VGRERNTGGTGHPVQVEDQFPKRGKTMCLNVVRSRVPLGMTTPTFADSAPVPFDSRRGLQAGEGRLWSDV